MKNGQNTMEYPAGYALLSRYRSELMGLAMLWVMLFHAYEFHFGVGLLDAFKELGFGGVDMFILLSGLGLYGSLVRRKDEPMRSYLLRRCGRILPTYWLVVGLYSLWLRLQGRISLSVGLWSLSTLHYWFHIPGSFNWYVPAILALYLLAPFWSFKMNGNVAVKNPVTYMFYGSICVFKFTHRSFFYCISCFTA